MPVVEEDGLQPILAVRPSDVAPRALVVGDPNRVDDVAGRLSDAREVGRSREYVTVTGTFDGVPVTVASHGVGASGAAICIEALCRAGVRTFVRAGTCGGLQPGVDAGHLVVGTAAVRDDGLTSRLLPDAWPAVADAQLTLALDREARQQERPVHRGVIHTAANFHPSTVFEEPAWRAYHRAGAVAVEMEFAALLVVTALHGARAGGIFTADGNLLAAETDMSDYDPRADTVTRAKSAMIDVALRALAGTDG
jgi:uridine phosphorylase